MLKTILAAILILLVAAGLVVGWFYWSFDNDMRADIRTLLANASRDQVIVSEGMLAGLPEPAQRYFRYAGVVGKPIPRTIRLEQKGRIRSGGAAGWMDFEAEEFYSTNPPALIWRAFLPTRALPIALGRDQYVGGNGSIVIRLLAMLALADERGNELGAAGLMRYLNEMTGFPAAFLGDNVTIEAVDDTSFRVSIADRGLTASGVLSVDAQGRMTTFRAQRFDTGRRSLQAWETPITAYGTYEGLNLPRSGAAVWKYADGDLTYIEVEMPVIAYDEPLAR